MAEGHGADQLVQELRGEYHPHQAHVFAKSELPVADNGNAAGFLSPMLKDEQAVVHCMSAVPRWGPHTEYLALIIGRQSDPSLRKNEGRRSIHRSAFTGCNAIMAQLCTHCRAFFRTQLVR